MAKVKNVSGSDFIVPALGGRLVLAGGTADVPDEDVYGYTAQVGNWSPADADAQAVHDAAVAAEAPPVEATAAEPLTPPARNASTEAWAAYAVTSQQAAPADVEGKTRDELVALYGPKEV